jgi:hypothetical protein
MEAFISSLSEQWRNQNEWASTFYDYDFYYDIQYNAEAGRHSQANTLDLLPANELNPNTALLYFKWAEASLDDVEKLFLYDGE